MPSLKERAKELGLITSSDPIQPGDLYLAERNTGPKLLTCRRVDERGWVGSVEMAYPYNVWECIKIVGSL